MTPLASADGYRLYAGLISRALFGRVGYVPPMTTDASLPALSIDADFEQAVVGALHDPETVAHAHRAGVGAIIDARIGGKVDDRHGDRCSRGLRRRGAGLEGARLLRWLASPIVEEELAHSRSAQIPLLPGVKIPKGCRIYVLFAGAVYHLRSGWRQLPRVSPWCS